MEAPKVIPECFYTIKAAVGAGLECQPSQTELPGAMSAILHHSPRK